MKVAFCHLSDIHFYDKKEKNPILNKIDEIIKSISSIIENETYVFILVSGDIAYSGKADEYEIALSFFASLKEGIEKNINNECYFLFVPGNHDCNYHDTKQNELVKSYRATVISENSTVLLEEICKIFSSYYSFESLFSNDDEEGTNLIKQKIYQMDKFKIIFNLVIVLGFQKKRKNLV